MKLKPAIAALFCLLIVILPSVSLQSATAATRATIVLVDPPHRDLNGISLDNTLETSLLPTERLGELVFSPQAEPRMWFIDAALVEDVQALAVKNLDAQNWLAELKYISANDPIFAIPYGHPNISLATELAPSELRYYFDTSKVRLEAALSRPVKISRSIKWGQSTVKVSADTIRSYTSNRRALALMSTVVPASELDILRSKLAFLLATDSTSVRQIFFARNAYDALASQTHKLRIVSGKYRLTSEKGKLPLTLVNDFTLPISVNLQLTPLNSRVHISDIKRLVLDAKSTTQILVPVTVIAPGTTMVLAQFVNSRNDAVNETAILTLNTSVISPTVAWFTTGSAILLFLAALTQSVRRVKRSRK
ncbi:MAG TPA: DUF6049 family protein [Candidatus Nanopelagicaceae bacterium]